MNRSQAILFSAVQGWRRILVLAGEDAASVATAAAFARAARKFGLKIVDTKTFELTNDPRRRERNNVALLTGGAELSYARKSRKSSQS